MRAPWAREVLSLKKLMAVGLFGAAVGATVFLCPGQAQALSAGSQPMHRLYNPNSGEHFYTASTAEKDSVVAAGWRYEGIGWTAPAVSDTPVWRLYNPNAGDHHYTVSTAERDQLKKAGWKDEGRGWYSDDAKSIKLYRQYNPNARAGSHNYTTSEQERGNLVSVGWRDEGLAWYGVDNTGVTRGQWIQRLVDETGADVPQANAASSDGEMPFTDVEGHENAGAIRVAWALGWLDGGKDFRPDAPADRNFAIVTAVLASGKKADGTALDASDKGQATHPEILAVAVAGGYVRLDGGKLNPTGLLTKTEMAQLLRRVADVLEAEGPKDPAGETPEDPKPEEGPKVENPFAGLTDVMPVQTKVIDGIEYAIGDYVVMNVMGASARNYVYEGSPTGVFDRVWESPYGLVGAHVSRQSDYLYGVIDTSGMPKGGSVYVGGRAAYVVDIPSGKETVSIPDTIEGLPVVYVGSTRSDDPSMNPAAPTHSNSNHVKGTAVDFSNCRRLEFVDLYYPECRIDSIKFNKENKVKYLKIDACNLDAIDCSTLPNLVYIDAWGNDNQKIYTDNRNLVCFEYRAVGGKSIEFDLSKTPNMESTYIYCESGQLNLGKMKDKAHAYVSGDVRITNVQDVGAIEQLTIQRNLGGNLDFVSGAKVEELAVDYSNFSQVTSAMLPQGLKHFSMNEMNNGESLKVDFSGDNTLESIALMSVDLDELDITGCHSLKELRVYKYETGSLRHPREIKGLAEWLGIQNDEWKCSPCEDGASYQIEGADGRKFIVWDGTPARHFGWADWVPKENLR